MPARSTAFQKLLVHLQTQLASGCEVRESGFLKHRRRATPREVDVVVRSTVGEHEVVIAIEAIEHKRPGDVTRAQTAFGDTTLTVVESEPGHVDVQLTVNGQPLPVTRR